MSGSRALKGIGRRVRSRLSPRPVLLAYHRIASTERDTFSLCVSPTDFAQQLEVLRRHGPILALPDLLRQLASEKRLGRASVITFDDGYLDNLRVALPLLEQHDVPATFFLTGSGVLQGRAHWWDELDRAVFGSPDLPSHLSLSTSRGPIEWFSTDASAASRRALVMQAHESLRMLDAAERDATVGALVEWSRVDPGEPPPPPLISTEQLPTLARHPLVTIGAHSMTHPWLSSLSAERQATEIRESRRVLQELTGQTVDFFAYPYGAPESYSTATQQLLAESGFQCACTTDYGALREPLDVWRIPRVLVSSWNATQLRRRLRAL